MPLEQAEFTARARTEEPTITVDGSMWWRSKGTFLFACGAVLVGGALATARLDGRVGDALDGLTDVRKDVSEVQAELTTKVAEVKAELKDEVREVKDELSRMRDQVRDDQRDFVTREQMRDAVEAALAAASRRSGGGGGG